MEEMKVIHRETMYNLKEEIRKTSSSQLELYNMKEEMIKAKKDKDPVDNEFVDLGIVNNLDGYNIIDERRSKID